MGGGVTRKGPNGHDLDGQAVDLVRFVSARDALGAGGGGGGTGGGGGDGQEPDPDGAAHWADVQHKDAIVLLNDSTFDEVLRRSRHVLVFFYAPWCNHCSSVKQNYATAAKELSDRGLRGCLAAVDYSSNPLLERRFRLEYLPALKLFYKGEFVNDYHKLRSREEFVHLIDATIKQNKT
ncbi:protein disulfide-isomerase A4 isoform X2 [Frankliniella occidentalis]|uniref:Protein disulfide-isomerase A4 isoform X2 n=1 Tax=Frankliniella occidentalis TaxID=133901 RepID=A0A9C6X6J4_FRAOC|nr:protein disulfide-isomerase A4 isoform X2 [Frankliniella occidentalis]